jgi:hypothetical protein
MSVPSCVMMPVRGARNPIFSSWACAGSNAPNAMAVARHNGGDIRDSVLIMSVPFRCRYFLRAVGLRWQMLAQRVELLNVRYWHKADIDELPPNVRFRG